MELALAAAASLRCQVVDREGQPVAGARLQLSTEGSRLVTAHTLMLHGVRLGRNPTWSAQTDAHGWALFHRLPPRVPLHPELSLAAGEEAMSFDLSLAAGEERIHRICTGGPGHASTAE